MLIDVDRLQSATELELLVTYETILSELFRRNVTRTFDAPVGQYAEWLAAAVLGGELAANSVKSYDMVCDEFGRVQIKARIVRGRSKRGETQLSPFRSFDFDHALILMFDQTYQVTTATIIAAATVRAAGRRSGHVNASVVMATPALLASGTDVTERFSPAP
jgi:hypothetical protein